jgi:hypothetical protein
MRRSGADRSSRTDRLPSKVTAPLISCSVSLNPTQAGTAGLCPSKKYHFLLAPKKTLTTPLFDVFCSPSLVLFFALE